MVPFLHSGHCNSAVTLRISWIMSTLNEQQSVCLVGELGEPILAFTRPSLEDVLNELRQVSWRSPLLCALLRIESPGAIAIFDSAAVAIWWKPV
jgi:MFS superfamily sulfate permease-like transporter